MPPATRAASIGGASVASDDSLSQKTGIDFSEILRNIDRLKKQRAAARKKTIANYLEKLTSIRVRLEKAHRQHLATYSALMDNRYRRLVDAIEKQTRCEDTIFEETQILKKDAEHLAMLIDAVYTARKESTQKS